MAKLLIVEDQVADLRVAANVAESLGFSKVEGRKTATSAKAYLESAIAKHESLPDVIILDLDLGYDSGHELLRFWHKNQDLSKTRMVVWTKLGKEQGDICRLFKVDAVVPKWEGAEALKAAIKPLTAKAG